MNPIRTIKNFWHTPAFALSLWDLVDVHWLHFRLQSDTDHKLARDRSHRIRSRVWKLEKRVEQQQEVIEVLMRECTTILGKHQMLRYEHQQLQKSLKHDMRATHADDRSPVSA